jgi:hypothetical protein
MVYGDIGTHTLLPASSLHQTPTLHSTGAVPDIRKRGPVKIQVVPPVFCVTHPQAPAIRIIQDLRSRSSHVQTTPCTSPWVQDYYK